MLMMFGGYLHDLYPKGIEVIADSAAEAITALGNFPGFREEDEVFHSVHLPDFGSRDAIYSKTDIQVLRIEPILQGAGGNKAGIWQIVIGVVLIATGWGAAAGTGIISSAMAGQLVLTGALMVLGGVVSLLMPQPQLDVTTKDPKSNYLPANSNTSAVGTPISLLFGTRRVWPHFLSYNVTATNLNEFPLAAPGNTNSAVADEDYQISYEQWPSDQP